MSEPASEQAQSPDGPEVLVVIVNYNAGELLVRSVDAVKRQNFRDFRLVVVDNASSDNSVERLRARHADVEIVTAGANLGFAAANNLAVRGAGGARWIALVNPDAFPEAGWLHTLVDAARAHPEFASFASRTLDARNPERIDGTGDAYHLSGRYWRRAHGCPLEARHMQCEEIFSACAAAALYSRSAWDAVGGLDEDFFCYGEDVDLGFRLQLAGYKCLYVPEALAYHRGSAIAGVRSDFSTYHGQRNLVWVYLKNMPSLLAWALLPYHLVMNLGAVIACAMRGQGRIAIKAKIDALHRLRHVLGKRASVQKLRQVGVGRIWKILEHGRPWPSC